MLKNNTTVDGQIITAGQLVVKAQYKTCKIIYVSYFISDIYFQTMLRVILYK